MKIPENALLEIRRMTIEIDNMTRDRSIFLKGVSKALDLEGDLEFDIGSGEIRKREQPTIEDKPNGSRDCKNVIMQ